MSLLLNSTKIINEWTDYNNHMNLSFYILVFDRAAEKILSQFKMGEEAAKKEKRSTMVVETHTTYNNEVKEGDDVEVFLSYFNHDKKRLHYKLEMYEKSKNNLSATTEVLALYMNLDLFLLIKSSINLIFSFSNSATFLSFRSTYKAKISIVEARNFFSL